MLSEQNTQVIDHGHEPKKSKISPMNETCPRCQYIRIPSDKGPQWQCPNCGAAYNKHNATSPAKSTASKPNAASRFRELEAQYKSTNQRLYALILLTAFLTFFSAFKKNELSNASDILPQLLEEPTQKEHRQQKSFSFEYMGFQYNVKTIADYELWGLVVSHNDIDGISDRYHDETSVDTKDLCVIWGDNLRTDDYQSASYRSGAWTCYFEYDGEVQFNHNQLSNSHIITDIDNVRETLNHVEIGDQIHISGMLVSYQDERHPDFWRTSSTVRTDSGNGACEVIFTREVEILATGNPQWRTLYRWSWKLLLVFILLKTAVFIREVTQ